MSVSTLLPAATKTENWSALKSYSLNTHLLQGDSVEVGLQPTNYFLPANIGSSGQIITVPNSGNNLIFSNPLVTQDSFTVGFGGFAPVGAARFLILNGTICGACASSMNNNNTFISPYNLNLVAITMGMGTGNSSTQWQIRVDNTFLQTFSSGLSTLILPVPQPLTANNQCTVVWQQVGTAPGDVTCLLWFTRQ